MNNIEEINNILKLSKDYKNLHHKKDHGGLLFITLSMIDFSKLKRYIKELQQKEFINYLEDEIKRINPDSLSISELINSELDNIKFTQYLIYKEILQKYKEIIGENDV